MIKTIIVEDEPKAAELLKHMLNEIDPKIEVLDWCQDLPSAIKSIKKFEPELIFLDVELPVYDGLQILDFLNPEEINFSIIFTTASNEHAVKAFEMSAVDYVLKPIQFDKLRSAVQKFTLNRSKNFPYPYSTLRDNLNNNSSPKIIIPQATGFEIINVDDIVYIKAEGSYSKIFLKNDGSLLVSNNLKYFEDLVGGEKNFIRVHRSHIVNVNYAKRILRSDGISIVLENGTDLPISGDNVDTVLQYFNFNKK